MEYAPLQYDINPVMALDSATGAKKPFFPIAWYSFGPLRLDQLKEVFETGVNCVFFADCGRTEWADFCPVEEHLARVSAALNWCQQKEIKVVIGFDGPIAAPPDYEDPNNVAYEMVREYVAAFRDHPALLGWKMGDEYSAEAAPGINATVEVIREAGSQHVITQVHPHTWSAAEVTTLMAKTDVCEFDGYTYLKNNPTFAEDSCDRVLSWQMEKASLVQEKGWQGNINVTQAVGLKCGTIDFRFPTYEEYRWNVFSAIASAGARGTINWIYSHSEGGFYMTDPEREEFFAFRDNTVKPVNAEQRMIQHAMETGYNAGKVRSNLDQLVPGRNFNRIGHLLLYDDAQGQYFLIVSNNVSNEFEMELTIYDLPVPLNSHMVTESHDQRQVELHELDEGRYKLTDRLFNHDVAIYVMK